MPLERYVTVCNWLHASVWCTILHTAVVCCILYRHRIALMFYLTQTEFTPRGIRKMILNWISILKACATWCLAVFLFWFIWFCFLQVNLMLTLCVCYCLHHVQLTKCFNYFFNNCIVPLGFLPWEVQELWQSCATQPTVHAGWFSVSRIHWTRIWTTGSLTCTQILMRAIAHGGGGGYRRTHVRACTEGWLWEEYPLLHQELNLCQRHAGQKLYQLSELHPHPFGTAEQDGGDGGFFLACKDFGRMFNNSFPTCTFFLLSKWRLACAHEFHSSHQDWSTVAQWAETTVTECSLTSCVCTRFLIGFPHYAWAAT